MKGLREKFQKNGGFTLVEMLIVVAIIAILIAVSFPMMSNALEGTRHAVDRANIRDAIALGSIEYLTNTTEDFSKNPVYVYTVDSVSHQGKLVPKGGTVTNPTTPECECAATDAGQLEVTIDKDGQVIPNWQVDDTNGTTTYTPPTGP